MSNAPDGHAAAARSDYDLLTGTFEHEGQTVHLLRTISPNGEVDLYFDTDPGGKHLPLGHRMLPVSKDDEWDTGNG